MCFIDNFSPLIILFRRTWVFYRCMRIFHQLRDLSAFKCPDTARTARGANNPMDNILYVDFRYYQTGRIEKHPGDSGVSMVSPSIVSRRVLRLSRSVAFVVVALEIVTVRAIDEESNHYNSRENNQEDFLGREFMQHHSHLRSEIAQGGKAPGLNGAGGRRG
jgi:hypothetical protein